MAATTTARVETGWWREVRRGALAIAVLWPGVAAFGAAFALLARAGGFNAVETQAMSMLVFAGSAQVAAVSLFAGGAAWPAILLTVLVLNLRHVLYALSLGRELPSPTKTPRALLACFLTDEAYGFAIRRVAAVGRSAVEPYYLGAALSLYVVFTGATLAGLLFGAFIPDPDRIALGFIFPLTFLALLMPMLRSRRSLLVVALSAGVAVAIAPFASAGVAVVAATLVAAGGGALLDLRRREAA